MTKQELLQKWLDGDIYLLNGIIGGIDSKDTPYDKMVEGIETGYNKQAFAAESPIDPYEYYETKRILESMTPPPATNCDDSIGGLDGTKWEAAGIWKADCKMFY